MKKLLSLFLVICASVAAFAGNGNRRFVASLDNKQVVQSQKNQRSSLRAFGSGRRYAAATRGRGFHPFGRRRGGSSGASKPESGLGL